MRQANLGRLGWRVQLRFPAVTDPDFSFVLSHERLNRALSASPPAPLFLGGVTEFVDHHLAAWTTSPTPKRPPSVPVRESACPDVLPCTERRTV